jgi:hypothetical protein
MSVGMLQGALLRNSGPRDGASSREGAYSHIGHTGRKGSSDCMGYTVVDMSVCCEKVMIQKKITYSLFLLSAGTTYAIVSIILRLL